MELQSHDEDKGKSSGVTDNHRSISYIRGTALVQENVMRKMMFKKMLVSASVVPVTQTQRQISVEKADHAKTRQKSTIPNISTANTGSITFARSLQSQVSIIYAVLCLIISWCYMSRDNEFLGEGAGNCLHSRTK